MGHRTSVGGGVGLTQIAPGPTVSRPRKPASPSGTQSSQTSSTTSFDVPSPSTSLSPVQTLHALRRFAMEPAPLPQFFDRKTCSRPVYSVLLTTGSVIAGAMKATASKPYG